MGIKLENSFVLDMAPDQAWALLNDVERIAPHVPGAKLTEVAGDEYLGTVAVKLGPITAQYKGTATITSRDDAARRLTLVGKGRDIRGQGTAGADLVATVVPQGAGSRVDVATDVQVTGKVAQLGRGIMQDVSSRLIDQFVANLARAEGGQVVAAPPAAAPAAPAPAAVAGTAGAGTPVVSRKIDSPDPEPIDLVKVGGGALFSRDLLIGGWMVAVLILLAIIALR